MKTLSSYTCRRYKLSPSNFYGLFWVVISSVLFSCNQQATPEVKGQENSVTIIYVGDPMCSWCWGISPEVTKLAEDYPVELIMGGLRPYQTEPMDQEMKAFLRHHWDEVGQRSGQPFSYDILESNDFVYDTEPAARAVVLVKQMKPEILLDFFKSVQQAFYVHNKNTNDITTYLELAEEYGLDKDEFERLYQSEELKKRTNEEFYAARNMGVNSFPTVLMRQADSLYIVARGYSTYEAMKGQIEQAVAQ